MSHPSVLTRESSLRSFVHFLYVLQTERPHVETDWEGGTDVPFDPRAGRARTREAMMSVAPAALKNPESQWHGVLTYIMDPEAHFE